jgi:hypothetical protein
LVGSVQVEHEHFPPRPLTKMEGEGEDWRGGGVEWLKILECEVVPLSGPPDMVLLPGLGPRDATEPPFEVMNCYLSSPKRKYWELNLRRNRRAPA